MPVEFSFPQSCLGCSQYITCLLLFGASMYLFLYYRSPLECEVINSYLIPRHQKFQVQWQVKIPKLSDHHHYVIRSSETYNNQSLAEKIQAQHLVGQITSCYYHQGGRYQWTDPNLSVRRSTIRILEVLGLIFVIIIVIRVLLYTFHQRTKIKETTENLIANHPELHTLV